MIMFVYVMVFLYVKFEVWDLNDIDILNLYYKDF